MILPPLLVILNLENSQTLEQFSRFLVFPASVFDFTEKHHRLCLTSIIIDLFL